MNTEEKIIELLWDYLEAKNPEHKDQKLTGWGTKTKQGLVACIERIGKESAAPIDDLDDRQTATILHALRHYQERHYGTAGECVEADENGTVCCHFDGVKPLTDQEIDALCNRLNSLVQYDAKLTRKAWIQEVAEGNTVRGLDEWREAQKEAAE